MKIVYTGLESAGKSLIMAKQAIDIISRNKKWFKKYGFKRPIASNMTFSDEFYEENKDYIIYWKDYQELLKMNGCDVFWDEISSDLSAEKRAPLPKNINRWLRQGAKQGVHIYATAQAYHDIHVEFRRRVLECININKLAGSRRSGKNMPPVNRIWGLCLCWEIKIHPSYNELEPEKESILPGLLFITRKLCSVFNTFQILDASEEPPYEHLIKKCYTCNYTRTIHR